MHKLTHKEKLNIDEMSDRHLKAYLNKIIDDEIDKPLNEQDIDLVRECVDFIIEIDNAEIHLTGDDIKSETQKILQKYNDCRQKLLKNRLKKSLTITACIILISCIMNFIAYAFGFNSLNVLKQWSIYLLDMPAGIELEKEQITFIKSNLKHQYDSISDLISGEKLNIMYPDYLPEGILLNRIDFIETDDISTYVFIFNKNTLSFDISDQYPEDTVKNLESSADIYKMNSITFYIMSMDDGTWQTVFIFNNMLYTIRYDDYNQLIKIINNIK